MVNKVHKTRRAVYRITADKVFKAKDNVRALDVLQKLTDCLYVFFPNYIVTWSCAVLTLKGVAVQNCVFNPLPRSAPVVYRE